MNPEPTTKAPDGFERVAWATYPSLRGVWRPSKVHLSDDGGVTVLCGARRPKRAKPYPAKHEGDFREHEQEAGLCSRCWPKAGHELAGSA